jgi:hypothetical protein
MSLRVVLLLMGGRCGGVWCESACLFDQEGEEATNGDSVLKGKIPGHQLGLPFDDKRDLLWICDCFWSWHPRVLHWFYTGSQKDYVGKTKKELRRGVLQVFYTCETHWET